MTPLKDIHALLDNAVRAGNAASDAIADHAADPFAIMLLQRIRLATAEYRRNRDELKVAMIALQKKSQAAALKLGKQGEVVNCNSMKKPKSTVNAAKNYTKAVAKKTSGYR